MRQLFFVSEAPLTQFPQLMGATFHVWTDGDAHVGVVNMDGNCDAEQVISHLESSGISWLPNHLGNETVPAHCVQCLSKHGVLSTDTTAAAMLKIHAKAGFPPLKPKRF